MAYALMVDMAFLLYANSICWKTFNSRLIYVLSLYIFLFCNKTVIKH